jgi:hypothetical protein
MTTFYNFYIICHPSKGQDSGMTSNIRHPGEGRDPGELATWVGYGIAFGGSPCAGMTE